MEIPYDVSARQNGNSVHFMIAANDIKEALAKAKQKARDIFDYRPGDSTITVNIKEAKIKDNEEV